MKGTKKNRFSGSFDSLLAALEDIVHNRERTLEAKRNSFASWLVVFFVVHIHNTAADPKAK